MDREKIINEYSKKEFMDFLSLDRNGLILTLFNDEGINIPEFEKFINFQIESGIDALVVCGTTGESSTMSKDEKIEAIKCAINTTKKRVPVIVGTGSNNTSSAIEMSKIA